MTGPRGLYDGLTGTLLRQMTYSMARFAAYDWAKGVVHTGELLVDLPRSSLTVARFNPYASLQDGSRRLNGRWYRRRTRKPSRNHHG